MFRRSNTPVWFLFITLCLCATSAFAEQLRDVIYLKNGSIIKGTIVEQDFTNDSYKIETNDGKLFVYTREEIDKISKEKVGAGRLEATAAYHDDSSNRFQDKHHYLYIGSYSETITPAAGAPLEYVGTDVGYQYGFTNYVGFRIGGYSAATANGQVYGPGSGISETDTGQYYEFILSSNLTDLGWQFGLGLGQFRMDITGVNYGVNVHSTMTGGQSTLIAGYAFSGVSLVLNVSGRSSGDFGSLTVWTDRLDLGIRF